MRITHRDGQREVHFSWLYAIDQLFQLCKKWTQLLVRCICSARNKQVIAQSGAALSRANRERFSYRPLLQAEHLSVVCIPG